MCGQFGWTLDKDKIAEHERDLKVVGAVLAIYNERRGSQSWGMWVGGKLKKSLGGASRISRKWLDKIAASPVVLFHTRHATHGDVVKRNAHPFRFGQIVGAHNGIVYNHNRLNGKYGRDFDVDSKHIIKHTEEGRGYDDIEAYGAVQIVDLGGPDGEVTVGRFHDGQLSLAKVPGLGHIWSSVKDDLTGALRMAGLDFTLLDVKENERMLVDPGAAYYMGEFGFDKPTSNLTWANYKVAAKDAATKRLPAVGWGDEDDSLDYVPEGWDDEDESPRQKLPYNDHEKDVFDHYRQFKGSYPMTDEEEEEAYEIYYDLSKAF